MSEDDDRQDRINTATTAVLEKAAEKGGLYKRYITEPLAREFAEAAIDALDAMEEPRVP